MKKYFTLLLFIIPLCSLSAELYEFKTDLILQDSKGIDYKKIKFAERFNVNEAVCLNTGKYEDFLKKYFSKEKGCENLNIKQEGKDINLSVICIDNDTKKENKINMSSHLTSVKVNKTTMKLSYNVETDSIIRKHIGRGTFQHVNIKDKKYSPCQDNK